ncbi:unnamed protein product [Adineta steineri]|uniref:EGF-like domain-containing protein n=1 Tax=Adineta steineri TaxID=433720 RepID=A0A814IWD9_9BILA|nr:unnamed protein product [Adineta steineri]
MHRFYFFFILLFRFVEGFYLQNDSEDYVPEQEPCNTLCQNGGQCFLSSFCICPKGFSGRYCEVSLNEQCGSFSSMTRIEIDCILCVCYNGLFICDIQPIGLCHRKSNVALPRSLRITHALHIIQNRFKNIHSFEPMTKQNITLDDETQLVNLNGYRIILNHTSLTLPSFFIDMQNAFTRAANPILKNVNATIASARRAGVPVIFSQHGHLDPENEVKTSVIVNWWGASGSIKKGSFDAQLLPNLDVAPDEVILDEKTTYDAFYKTRLKSLLDKENVDTVIISGVLTQFCCETTARSAFVQNYDVIFLSDGTGPRYKPTLDTIAHGFGKVITCAQMRERLDEIAKDRNK